jgi:hypothetical protein
LHFGDKRFVGHGESDLTHAGDDPMDQVVGQTA